MSKNIILVDKRVQDYETIVAAVDPALAVSVVFDYFEDTFDALKARIGAIGLTNGANQVSVGLIQHNYRAPLFSMLASAELAPVSLVAAQDPELERWTQFRDFIAWCKTEHSAAHFDMMACALYSDPDWKYVIDTLTAQTGVTVRASTDDTGAAALGGDWFLESHTGVNLKTVYFTELIDEYRGVLYLSSFNNRNYSTKGFATGTIEAWGDPLDGGNGGGTAESNCVAVYSIFQGIFLALQTTGRIVKWGRTWSEYNPPSTVNSGVVAIYSTYNAFAALKNDGTIVAWGNSTYGGSAPTTVTAANSGVSTVYVSGNGVAALKTDSSVVSWGNGDTAAPSSVTTANSGVVAVYSNYYSFAALKTDGSIVAWGSSAWGAGTVPSSVTDANSGVVAVYSNDVTFAALKSDGSIVAWSDERYGGSAPSSVTAANSGVVAVYSNSYTFAALKNNGSVVSWGDLSNVGTPPTTVTAANSGVVAVYATWGAFAALKADGTVVAWGNSTVGGTAPSSVTAANSGVVAVYSAANGAFAALKSNGSVVAWGSSNSGGTTAPSNVTAANSGVVAIYSTYNAFVALKTDGSIVAWGHTDYNISINNGGVAPDLRAHSVWSNYNCFAALKTTATTFNLSAAHYRDIDRYDILRKKENRRRVNLTTLNNNVFTLSATIDIQIINSKIPAGRILRIIVPTYVSSFYSITSTATIPSSSGNFIVACDESEPVTISGSTYVNYGTFVYLRETNNTYTKITSATINGRSYTLYGGDGIQSSGIVFLEIILEVSTFSSSTFAVETSKTFGDASFAIVTRPTSNSPGAIAYSSSNTAVATIDASGNWITLVAAGDVSFNATQAAAAQYAAATKASNTLTVARGLSNLSASSTFTVAETKTFGDASFAIGTRPTSNSTGAITYSSSNTAVATIDASGNWITLVAAGDVSFNATQAQTAQYFSATKSSNTLTVARGISNLSASSTFTVAETKTFGDASFAIVTRPTSNSTGAITYSSSNTAVATIDASGNWITLVAAGDVSFNATQAQTAQYLSATKASNPLAVARGTPILSTFTVSSSKTLVDASFVITAPRPTSNSTGAITYSSSNPDVATIDASGNWITLVGVGDVSFNATQAQTAQYLSATKASNTLTVSKATPTLAFESSPPATKSVIDAAFTVTATSASPGAITYTSSNIAFATVGLTTGLVTLKGIGTVTITAAQAANAQYNAPTNTTYSVEIRSVGSTFAGQIISPETSLDGVNFSGALLVGTTLSGVSFSGATLTNVDFSGATITGTNFTNANISGATNLPAFSTAQKLQLLSNINNVAISEIQINTQLSGADINAILPTPIPAIATATFTLKVPTTLDASLNKVLTITSVDLSNNASVYIPLNANESVSINGTVFSFNGTNILDADSNPRTYLTVAGIPFKIYAGSVIALNILNVLNNVTFAGESSGSGMYNILSELFTPK